MGVMIYDFDQVSTDEIWRKWDSWRSHSKIVVKGRGKESVSLLWLHLWYLSPTTSTSSKWTTKANIEP